MKKIIFFIFEGIFKLLSWFGSQILFIWHRMVERLPTTIVKYIARLLFIPTLSFRLIEFFLFGSLKKPWWNKVDELIVLGAFPLPFLLPKLIQQENIKAVINCCEENKGPTDIYQKYGIVQLYIPTIDYLPPSLEDCKKAIDFIRTQTSAGNCVYIHCKAGRGRSATIALIWLCITKSITPEEAQKELFLSRPVVSKRIFKRKVVHDYLVWAKSNLYV
eukprot:TRINITY_DN315_c4_g1_i1.p1 TRINITY_DN315_c4_g1~~TRINITY_DN315_c4_g1_i1.p1  ORF type:complete len:243 (+),score=82.92 TRINITY_DN315_c4_g1_i1:78-731(+)